MDAIARWRVALNITLLKDAERESILAGIQKVAQQSTLMQIPAIAASYAALTTKGTTFATNVSTAAANEKLWKASAAARDVSRDVFDMELDTFKTLIENNATSAADVAGTGLALLTVTKSAKTVPDAPATPIVKPGRQHGRATVLVPGKGYIGRFVAEMSTDPIGAATWAPLPGNGKSRVVSGPTGTKVWVHFAMVRWGLQSAWSTPVLVTIP
jgi:hypothetical protein